VQPDYLPSIPPEQRGHGFGRQAMLLAEKLAGEHGATTIGLNVFAENVAARSLYASLNYEETALQMRKPLWSDFSLGTAHTHRSWLNDRRLRSVHVADRRMPGQAPSDRVWSVGSASRSMYVELGGVKSNFR